MIGFLVGAFFLNTIVSLTLGLLWHGFVERLGWTSVHAYWLPALLVGVAIPLTLMALPLTAAGEIRPPIDSSWMTTFALLMTLGISFGALTALFAWLIRRPDRDAANPRTPAP